ncbi:hypothetical protein ACVWZZ_002598 [Bradyrhizobium sp. LM6.10]|uniref:hypothetical protein n=2 Tax=Bradyrhizobium TaxID=374 RepID=UPI001FFA3EB1|nr:MULTISPECIES: hypothetical protein [unclassified Bradyrhizobium]MCK1271557.1 hypothetical protein [Bradyrhizobium sp. 84]MCK1375876.1 hypothetical protein [Bradyrhizobium sp. 49]MCK1423910.1 hypothetical protein [Bradyrhizobium sp. CW12]MCK1508700.1 hypothetical protein [Bradyrhizobium sp. 18]MCK1526438.1 hypothetical protein [Bradyrhizobium sp. 182]
MRRMLLDKSFLSRWARLCDFTIFVGAMVRSFFNDSFDQHCWIPIGLVGVSAVANVPS